MTTCMFVTTMVLGDFSYITVEASAAMNDDRFLTTLGSAAAVCNTAGRILWGLFADKVSFKVKDEQLYPYKLVDMNLILPYNNQLNEPCYITCINQLIPTADSESCCLTVGCHRHTQLCNDLSHGFSLHYSCIC
ncbi:hypothetical protein EB796_019660 [Bugula neritina]|uniref:Uncharacterized protein n=1 Tax=Bugula neritina TaxID=10212 RepID=A0A7J7J8X8_BUGNE|nr:hypothetical protein EB796_019660 [Bugula neritina]